MSKATVKKVKKVANEKVVENEIVSNGKTVENEIVANDTNNANTNISTPSNNTSSTFLKSVNPFDFIKKSTSQHTTHSTQEIVSGLASLQLEERQRLGALFKDSTRFEASFFAHFHATGSVSAFASESAEERRASSRLISPTCAVEIIKTAQQMKFDLPASVLEALICSGHLSVYRSDLVERALLQAKKSRSSALVRVLLATMEDFSDAELVKLIVYVLEAPGSFSYASEADFLLLRLLAMPKSPQLLKTYLLAVATKTVCLLLKKILGFLEDAKCTGHRRGLLMEWMGVVVDSQYPLCLRHPELMSILSEANAFLHTELELDVELSSLAGVVAVFTRNAEKEAFMRFLPKADMANAVNAHYSVVDAGDL